MERRELEESFLVKNQRDTKFQRSRALEDQITKGEVYYFYFLRLSIATNFRRNDQRQQRRRVLGKSDSRASFELRKSFRV